MRHARHFEDIFAEATRVLDPAGSTGLNSRAMNRSSGIGLMAFGIVLVVVGAIMKFAVTATTSGFNINKAGLILLLVGIGVFVVSLPIIAMGGRSSSTTRSEIRETPSGQERIEQRDDKSTP